MRYPGFIGPSYTLDSPASDCQRTVGLYPEINEARTAPNGERGRLISIPGNKPYLNLGSVTIRGFHVASDGTFFVVAREQLYKIKSTGQLVGCGSLLTTTGRVSMADNGFELMVVDGSYGYTYSFATSTLTRITAGGFYPASVVRFMDGYFIVNRPGTKEFRLSALYDGQTWNALDFASIEGTPDDLLTHEVLNKQVWFFKSRSIEIWYDSGAASFPFERISGGLLEYGCASPYCVAKVGPTVIWLDSGASGNGVVWAANGYVPQRISTHAVEQVIQKSRNIADAYAWSYQDGGHSFYCLTIPYSDTTWCYDLATGLWCERQTLDSHNRRGAHRVAFHAFAYNKHFTGDVSTGDIYEMDRGHCWDGTSPLLRLRAAPHLNSSNKRLFFSSLQVDMEVGVGIDGSGQGSDPRAMLRWSDDRGHTWSDIRTVGIGKIGEFDARAIWRRLGSARDRVFEVSITDPVPVTLLGADVAVTAGAN